MNFQHLALYKFDLGAKIRLKYAQYYLPQNKKVLEVGYGSGMFNNFLRNRGNAVTVIDMDPKLGKKYIVGDFLKYDFKGEKFDCVVLSHVLEHFDDEQVALLKVKELLNPDGYLFVAVPYDDSENKDHKRVYARDSIMQAIDSAGFQVIAYNEWESIVRSFLASLLISFPKFKRHRAVDLIAVPAKS